jgi:hypothetical protein
MDVNRTCLLGLHGVALLIVAGKIGRGDACHGRRKPRSGNCQLCDGGMRVRCHRAGLPCGPLRVSERFHATGGKEGIDTRYEHNEGGQTTAPMGGEFPNGLAEQVQAKDCLFGRATVDMGEQASPGSRVRLARAGTPWPKFSVGRHLSSTLCRGIPDAHRSLRRRPGSTRNLFHSRWGICPLLTPVRATAMSAEWQHLAVTFGPRNETSNLPASHTLIRHRHVQPR